MNYTAEKLREQAACYKGCHGGLGRERDLMLALADKIEECERLRKALELVRDILPAPSALPITRTAVGDAVMAVDAALREGK